MKKNDDRNYNRKHQRDLSIEMDLWCLLKDKVIESKGCFYDGKPVAGIIKNVIYYPGRTSNICTVELDNGTKYNFEVKHGKILMEQSVIII
jgi:ribosomal protein L2